MKHSIRWLGVLLAAVALVVGGAPAAHAASATLTWTDNSTNEDGFHAQRKADICAGPAAFVEVAHINANIVTYVDGSVVEGGAYCYRVNAFNTAGESDWSNTAGIVIPYSTASVPGPLAIDVNTGGLAWLDKTTNEGGFIVQRKPDLCAATGTFTTIHTTLPNVTTFNDTQVVEGGRYCYRVAAMNALTTSPWTNTVERLVPLTVPAVPSQLGVTVGP